MFADDTKIYTAVKDIADSQRLQADLDSLAQWAKDWLLRFNVNVCQLDLSQPLILILSQMQTMLLTVFPPQTVRKILESGYLLHCIQVFNAKNPMLMQCKALLLLNEHSNTLQKNHLTSFIKHIHPTTY